MNDFVLGKYIQKNTFIHKIDARLKVFVLVLLMVAIFLGYGTYITTFIIDTFLLLFVISLVVISKIKFSSIFKSLKLIWITLLFVFLINILIPHSNFTYELININGFIIYLESIFQSIKIFLRVFMLVLLTLILTSTTKSMDIAYAFSWYMTPLRFIKIPVDDISMVMSLTLRFIPLILEETQRIKKAQESRGINFEKGNIFKRLKAFISLIVPLLVSSFSRSIEMADAMEVRGYVSGERRTRYNVHKFSSVDAISFLTTLVLCSLLFYLSAMQFDLINVIFGISNPITILR